MQVFEKTTGKAFHVFKNYMLKKQQQIFTCQPVRKFCLQT